MSSRFSGLFALALLLAPALGGQVDPMPLSPELERADAAELERAAAEGSAPERVAALTRLAALAAHAEPARALELATEAVELARRAADRHGEMEALYVLGYVRRHLADYPAALEAIEQSIALALALRDERALANGHDLLGLTLLRIGQVDEALDAHLDAYAIREGLDDLHGLAYSHNNLGNAYRRLGDFPHALEHHREAIALKEALGHRGSLAYSHENLGDVHRAMGNWQEALACYERARALHHQFPDPAGLASVLTGIGIVRQAQGEGEEALALFDEALELWRGAGEAHGEAVARLNRGRALASIGRRDEADAELGAALAGFEEIGARLRVFETLEALAELERARDRPAAALAHLVRAHALEKSASSTDLTRRLARARHDRERALELRAQRRERDALAALALLALVLVGAVSWAYLQRRRSEQLLAAKAEALERALGESRTLRGLLPICAGCKRIRDDAGYWEQLEVYIRARSEAEFTHGLCPDCARRLFPEEGPEGGAA